jgi:DNA-binding LacI/PurR family transcriptional regulator
MIAEGRVQGQTKLPAERELCGRLEVSRVTLGKILTEFTKEGLLIRRHGSGTYIAGAPGGNGQHGVALAILIRQSFSSANPYFATLLGAIGEAGEELGVHLQVIDRVREQFEQNPTANRLLTAIDGGIVNGVIVASRMPAAVVAELHRRCPTVVANHFGATDEIPAVLPDYAAAAGLAVRHLTAQGRRRLAFFAPSFSAQEAVLSAAGFRVAAECLGCEACGELETGTADEPFSHRIREFLAAHAGIDGIVFCNGLHVPRLVRLLGQDGLRAPGAVGVVGLGQVVDARPGPAADAAYIDLGWHEVGRVAVEMLLARLRGKTLDRTFVLAKPRLVAEGRG